MENFKELINIGRFREHPLELLTLMEQSNKKIFAILFFSLFATITGVGIVVPLLPVYAKELGAGGLYIGMIFGAFSVSRTLFLPYFGRKSDQKGRKPFIVIGLLGYSLIAVAFIFASSINLLIGIRLVQGIASAMIMPAVLAYIGDITPENQEGFTMGLFNMSIFMGLSFGPVAGGMIHDVFSLNVSFLCMGILSLIGFSLSLWLLPPTTEEQTIRRGEAPSEWWPILRDRDIAGLFAFRFTYTACIGIIWSFLPIFADTEFSLSSSEIGILVMLGVFVSGLIQTPMGMLADRSDKKAMVIIGGLITCGAMASFIRAQGFWSLFLTNILFGLGGGISTASHSALTVQKGSKTKAMGTVMSLMTVAHSMGMMTGALFAGLMMDMFELGQAFFSGSLIMTLGVVLFFMMFTCQTAEAASHSDNISYRIRETRRSMKPLDVRVEPEQNSSAIAYFQYYGLHFEGIRHFFGTFESQGYVLAAHVFQPPDPKGTIFLIHGYFDHIGNLRNLIRFCLDQGFAVAGYDLPGHGLSTGEPAAIRDFSEYGDALEDFVAICLPVLSGPYHLIGHSTGGSAAIEYIRRGQNAQTFEKIMLVAPLVRFPHWELSKAAYCMINPFAKTLPRKIPESSSDPEFIEFLKKDPLRGRRLSLKWVRALYEWEKRFRDEKPIQKPILIIQGDADTVVDWQYNIPFLKRKFENTEIIWIENGRHQLFNETDTIQNDVFRQIQIYLK